MFDRIVDAALVALRDLFPAREPTKADFALVDGVLADRRPARPGEWCAFDRSTGAPVVPDLTRGAWPDKVCNQRRLFTIAPAPAPEAHLTGPFRSRQVTCTRIAEHTGRHAAGSGGLIVAVWDARP